MGPAILVVESEGVLERALSLLDETLNLQLHVAHDALQAITLVQRHSFEALIIDGGLAYIDGWALLRYLEDNLSHLDAIVVAPQTEMAVEFVREFAGRVELVELSDLPEAVARRLRPGGK